MLVDLPRAQALFEALPAPLRWPTLAPAYVAADARREAGARPVFLAAEGPGLLLHSLIESSVEEIGARDWQSAYGYGGPLATGLDDGALAAAWARIDEIAASRGVVAEFVRLHPALDQPAIYPGTVRHDRNVVIIDLGVTNLLASYTGRARTAVRKARNAGLEATWQAPAEACASFPDFYRRSMGEIGASSFYLFADDYFEALLALPGARVLRVHRAGETLSMGLFLFGPCQAEYHLSGTSPAGRDVSATNLLLHTAAEAAQAQGARWLNLGGGTTSREDDALLGFKSSFAAPRHAFNIAYRVHDAAAYERLRQRHPTRAASGRVLFYR